MQRSLIPRIYYLLQQNSAQFHTMSLTSFNKFLFAAMPAHEKLAMPSLSPTMQDGSIQKWLKKEGDKLEPGDFLMEVETDKAVVGFEMQDTGYLAKRLYPDGAKHIPLGSAVAIVVKDKSLVDQFKDYKEASGATPAPAAAPASAQEKAKPAEVKAEAPKAKSDDSNIPISPLGKRLALAHDIPLSSLKGTGADGRILRADVNRAINEKEHKNIEVKQEAAVESKPQQKSAAAKKTTPESKAKNPFKDTPTTQMRQIIAQRLTQCKQEVPHYYLQMDIQMDALMALRNNLNTENKLKISINDFIVKATALACMDVPECNSQWCGEYIRKYQYADVSVAVSTEGGLITPVIFKANSLGLKEISSRTKALAVKARDRKLLPEEYQGGTITVSNLGMFSIDKFIGVINPPQACLLALGATSKELIPNDDVTKEQKYKIANIMQAWLSCDHRVVDGSVGSKWLQRLKYYLEKPYNMML